MRKIFVMLSLLLAACTSKPSGEVKEMNRDEEVKMEQYMVAGELLFAQYCANCHQSDGKGLAELYPPLDASDYLESNLGDLPCIIKNGIQGELVVNGVSYNQVMPGLSMLTDLEIAEISTYVANAWSNDYGYIGVKEVTSALSACEN